MVQCLFTQSAVPTMWEDDYHHSSIGELNRQIRNLARDLGLTGHNLKVSASSMPAKPISSFHNFL